jgi:hypothetical protein
MTRETDQSMSLLVAQLLETPGVDLRPTERLALLILAAHVNQARGDDEVWPSLATVAQGIGSSGDTARRSLRTLVERGLLTLMRPSEGRGRPPVYRVERVAICDLLTGKRVATETQKGGKPGARIGSNTEVRKTKDLSSAEADAVALADLWNRTVTNPIPKVRLPLSQDRVRVYAKAWGMMTLEEWSLVMAHLNAQDWCRASGVGDHPSWVATLDWLTKKPATWQRHLEKAQTVVATRGPRSRAEAYRQTNERNAASVGSLPMSTVGGRVDDDQDQED